MYEDQTFETIMTRLLNSVPSEIDKSEGSFIYDALAPAAIELTQAYIQMDRVLQLGFVQTTYGQYLDYRAAENGLTRKEATKATGIITITGANGTTAPVGTLFSTGGGVPFQTTAEVSIGEAGQIDVAVEAVFAGTSGNVAAATITQIPVSIPGVTGVTNSNPTSGGTDEESDSAFLERLLEKVRLPSTSGNTAHYKQWAKEVAGVGDVKVFPIWNGPGTVKVVVIDVNKQPAIGDIVTDVTEYIEEVRPIGATVTVISATGVNIDVSATVTLTASAVLADVQTAFEAALLTYLKEIAFKQDYVSYAQIGSLLLDTLGIMDYDTLTINTGTGNISIGDTQVAVKGTVTLSESV